jgi:hypothetical protein
MIRHSSSSSPIASPRPGHMSSCCCPSSSENKVMSMLGRHFCVFLLPILLPDKMPEIRLQFFWGKCFDGTFQDLRKQNNLSGSGFKSIQTFLDPSLKKREFFYNFMPNHLKIKLNVK